VIEITRWKAKTPQNAEGHWEVCRDTEVSVPRSRIHICFHCVWATRNREPFLQGNTERRAYRVIQAEARQFGCLVLALGGIADHVHLVVQLPPALSVATLIKQVKGASSRIINQSAELTEALYWQEGYNADSVCRSHLSPVIAYVQNQKRHHAAGTLWDCEDLDD